MKIDVSSKKYLVTSGCSFTDGFNMGKYGSWAYYLSNLTNLKLHNVAKGGAGNEYISDAVISYLIRNDEVRENCVVGVAWSEITRLTSSIYDGDGHLLDTVRPQDFITNGKYAKQKDAQMFFHSIAHCIYKTYMSIIKLNHFLDYYKIPYFYIDAINETRVEIFNDNTSPYAVLCTYYAHADCINVPLSGPHDGEYVPIEYSQLITPETNNKIFKNFIKLGGYKSILQYMCTDYDKYELGNPGHPNDIASQEIAELIYNELV